MSAADPPMCVWLDADTEEDVGHWQAPRKPVVRQRRLTGEWNLRVRGYCESGGRPFSTWREAVGAALTWRPCPRQCTERPCPRPLDWKVGDGRCVTL